METTMPNLPFKMPSTKWLIRIASIVVVVVMLFSFYGYVNGLRDGGVTRENRLSRQYETLKSGLDSFLSSAREAAGVTKAQSAAFDKIMLDAVQGRYQKDGQPTTAQPGSGTLFSAIAEAYPNLDGINASYTRILDIITSGRQAFANNQAKLQDQLREYDDWRGKGIIRSKVISGLVGVPSDRLIVRNDKTLKGLDAYEVMSKVIVSDTTGDAFNSGKLEPQDFFGQ